MSQHGPHPRDTLKTSLSPQAPLPEPLRAETPWLDSTPPESPWRESPWIVRGETIAVMRQADAMRAAAAADAQALRVQAAVEAEALRQQARQQGMQEGAAVAAALLADAEAAAHSYQLARSAELGTLAFGIAHRILGAFPEDERLARAVTNALDEHRGASNLRLRADPQSAALLREALNISSAGSSVIIEADHGAASGSCTLVHPRGRVAVGPVDQLRALLAGIAADAPDPGT